MQPIMPGYSFVPKGNVYITRKAKEYTKEIKKTVYIVHRNLSYPLGIQVPTKIHNKAVEHEKLTKEDRDHTTQLKDIREKREAIACLQGMFGKMPKEERETIVERAFERVGIPSLL